MSQKDLSSRLKAASTPVPKSLYKTLITANHILHKHGIVDAYGHVSLRSPNNPATFILSASVAPALVSSRQDLVEYNVSDASPTDPNEQRKGYLERYIHSEIYKQYPDVQSVVHAHAEAVLPFTVTSVPLQPVFHMGGVMGPTQVPVYEISNHYAASDPRHDLLISSRNLGASLAKEFAPQSWMGKTGSVLKSFVGGGGGSGDKDPAHSGLPPHPVVLMRGHGFTAVGGTIEEAIYRSYFTVTNARILTTSLLLQGSYNTGVIGGALNKNVEDRGKVETRSVRLLDERECKDAWAANATQASRPWGLWVKEVETSGLYDNEFYDQDNKTLEEEV